MKKKLSEALLRGKVYKEAGADGFEAWQKERNIKEAKINWQFTNEKATVKLKRMYQTLST
jgi:2-methylisocitrate lyase-like PEP mutase family enzyme